MRHSYFGKKLSRTKDQRKQLLRNLACSLIQHGKLNTTKAKAIAMRSMIEKLITRAKKGGQPAYRRILADLGNGSTVKLLMEDAKTRFAARSSGYTRILRFGLTGSDAKDLVQISFVDPRIVQEVVKAEKSTEGKEKKAASKIKETKTKTVKKSIKK